MKANEITILLEFYYQEVPYSSKPCLDNLLMHILLITRHYPPEISGGARRPFLLTEALRSLGHQVTLVCPFKVNDSQSILIPNNAIDNALHLQSKPPTIAPGQQDPWEKSKSFLRQWLFWPDPDIRWARNVIKELKSHQIKADWIMTTSPPESIHFVGLKLSTLLGIPWIAEMRDTWVDTPHRPLLERSKIRALLERRIAKNILSKATAITAVSEAVMKEARTFCSLNTPQLILPHFSNTPTNGESLPNKNRRLFDETTLNLVHTGGFSLSDRRRKLSNLLDALTQIARERPELVLHIVGPLTYEETSLLKETPVRVRYHGCVPLEQAHAMQREADGLLLCTPEDSHALPGKYAEYALAHRPIFYLGGGDWLSLVEDKSTLRPLLPSLVGLQKHEKVITQNALTHLDAAKTLIAFLQEINTTKISQKMTSSKN